VNFQNSSEATNLDYQSPNVKLTSAWAKLIYLKLKFLLKGQCHEIFIPYMEGLGLHKEPLTGYRFFRALEAKV